MTQFGETQPSGLTPERAKRGLGWALALGACALALIPVAAFWPRSSEVVFDDSRAADINPASPDLPSRIVRLYEGLLEVDNGSH